MEQELIQLKIRLERLENRLKTHIHNGIDSQSLGGAEPGGADTQIQYNDGGVFAGGNDLVWDKTNDILTISQSIKIDGGNSVLTIVDDGGNIVLRGSNSVDGANGGEATVIGGTGDSGYNGGDVTIQGGYSGGTSGADGSDVGIYAGDANVGGGIGGSITIQSGNGDNSGGGSGSGGGDVNIIIGTGTGNGNLNITGLPTASAGLSTGDVWSDGGTLKIV
jgi:hypothetical protein